MNRQHPEARQVWTVAEARSRLSEVLRRAEEEGPQQIGRRRAFVVVPRPSGMRRRSPACPWAGGWSGICLAAPTSMRPLTGSPGERFPLQNEPVAGDKARQGQAAVEMAPASLSTITGDSKISIDGSAP